MNVVQEQKVMEALASILKEQPEFLQPFFEEFAQGQELKEELSQYLPQVEQAKLEPSQLARPTDRSTERHALSI